MKITQHSTKSAIDAEIESCYQTKLRHGYTQRAIIIMQENGSLGFRFGDDGNVGDVLNCNNTVIVAVV